VAAVAENRPRGRPGLLSDAIVARVAAGDSLEQAARAAGVAPRTLRTWRSRAWSRRAKDDAYVRLERRIVFALGAANASARTTEAKPESWEQVAARVEGNALDWAALDAELSRELDARLGSG
jgi:lambda repressor-like predicted transcriptional regulator